jgi:poly(3-hydroxyalkanoate) synthetase
MEFYATETWLYDSPLVIGEIYREFEECCYKQNLLVKNKISIEDRENNAARDSIVNLKKINLPFLNIIAKYDDLVEPDSSKALNDVLTGSRDKYLFEFRSRRPDDR